MRKIAMHKQLIQMVASVAVVVLLSLFGNVPDTTTAEMETATVADSLDEATEEDPAVTVPVSADEQPGDEPQDETKLPESFEEGALEEEFGEVQAGIDLLDSPLQ